MLCYNSCLPHLQHSGVVSNSFSLVFLVIARFLMYSRVLLCRLCFPLESIGMHCCMLFMLFVLLFVLVYWPCCGRCCIWANDCLELISAGTEGVPAPSNLRPVASFELDDLHGELQCPSGKWCHDNEWLLPMHKRLQLKTQQCQITHTIKNSTRWHRMVKSKPLTDEECDMRHCQSKLIVLWNILPWWDRVSPLSNLLL
jgi:hypothetical protein